MQTSIPECFETLNDALKEAVRAAGGNKPVGAKLWPELPPDAAANRLRDCLNADRREKLSPEQAQLILRWACEVGYHGAMAYFCYGASYDAPTATTPDQQHDELQRKFVEAVEGLAIIQDRMRKLQQARRRA